MDYKTDGKRVIGLGSARDGTHHWWEMKITSVALIPLGLLFIFPFALALGDGYEAARALYSNPFHGIVAALFIVVALHHLKGGLQVVIEDYVHHHGWKIGLILGVTLFVWAVGAAALYALVKIGLGG